MRVIPIPYYTNGIIQRILTLNELSQLDSCSETSSNNEDDTEDVVSSSTNTQDQESPKKLHPPVQCKYCFKKFKCGLATRMQNHTNDCLNAPELAKTIKKPKLQDSNLIQQSTIVSYVDRMDHNEITNLDYKFAKAIYALGIPLNTFTNPFWVEFFNALRPSFKIPNRDKLSTGLLENVYEDIKNDVKQKIDNIQNLTMYPNEEASRIYAELLKFRNKQIPYNNELIWNSAIYLNPLTW
ncbi:17374_t:CDS:2 [Cetraspora pellucida]|uniref:17374_t:CDS:1 n=1 Tax=Cetraspora pellucida TaxID=1433469 RepID=A0ACA9KL83_9GLOM|nr:17374_t:CDS:2 [Cetraspora pellucida]